MNKTESLYLISECVEVHDEVLGGGVPVLDLALVAVWVNRQLGHVEPLRSVLNACLGSNGHHGGTAEWRRPGRLGLALAGDTLRTPLGLAGHRPKVQNFLF